MPRRRPPALAAIRDNPALHPRAFALVQARFPNLKWHAFAHAPNSSHAFALSAFLPLLDLPDKDTLLDRFVTGVLPASEPRAGRSWEMVLEFADPSLLREAGGGEPTRIDILLVADDAAVCIESKFRVDARQGWGRRAQPPRLCEGYQRARLRLGESLQTVRLPHRAAGPSPSRP